MNSPKACARHAFGAFGVHAQVILLSIVNDFPVARRLKGTE